MNHQGETMHPPSIGPATLRYLDRMRGCARSLGRTLGPVDHLRLAARVAETDAELVELGLAGGLLRIEGNYLRTRDPRQAKAWLVEGDPARPCWEYVTHAAAYVELVERYCYPVGSVRFETSDSEEGLSLDLVVVDEVGSPMVLGEVKREAWRVRRLAELLREHLVDPGKPAPVGQGGPSGLRREAWKLAHQLWGTRAPWLWLVAPGERLAFVVRYDAGLSLEPAADLPAPDELPGEPAHDWPVLDLPETWVSRDICRFCASTDVFHIVIGMPRPGEMLTAPEWVEFAGCVVKSGKDRRCGSCGRRWHSQE